MRQLIEAMRLVPGTDNYKDVCDWIHGDSRGEIAVSHDGNGAVLIDTPEGMVTARPGDWVIKSAAGEFRPLRLCMFCLQPSSGCRCI